MVFYGLLFYFMLDYFMLSLPGGNGLEAKRHEEC